MAATTTRNGSNKKSAAPDQQTETITTKEGHVFPMTTTHAFEIPTEEAHELLSRGRKPSRSVYHDDVAHAAKPENRGKMFGIKPEGDQKITTILSQIRIAAKAHGVKTKVVNRLEEKGYVGFIVVDEPAVDPNPATSSIPVVASPDDAA